MKNSTIVALYLSMISFTVSCQPIRTVSVTVIGDDKNPIENAEVVVWFSGYHPHQSKSEKGLTNKDGRFEASGQPILSMITRVNKEGYYETESEKLLKSKNHDLTITLRRKMNPIPLIARKMRSKLPGLKKQYGFDFEIEDWVSPEGKGKVADVFFTAIITEDDAGQLGGKLKVTFPHKTDGVLVIDSSNGYLPRSKMKMPNLAPTKGDYEASILRTEFSYENLSKPKNTSYFFRTREDRGSDGKLTYHYSKLLDGIDFYMGGGRFLQEPTRSKYPIEYAQVDFIYYFNPDRNNRNLEFDTKQNLVRGLKNWDRVNNP